MYVDYRRLNSITKFDCLPLPPLDKAFDVFSGAMVFSSLDLAITYHQVPVKPSDVVKTAFIKHVRFCKMSKMPFVLCNALLTYQRLMAGVIHDLIGRICLAYLNDVIVVTKKRFDHTANFRAVLDQISPPGLKLKNVKCSLFCEQVRNVGHFI